MAPMPRLTGLSTAAALRNAASRSDCWGREFMRPMLLCLPKSSRFMMNQGALTPHLYTTPSVVSTKACTDTAHCYSSNPSNHAISFIVHSTRLKLHRFAHERDQAACTQAAMIAIISLEISSLFQSCIIWQPAFVAHQHVVLTFMAMGSKQYVVSNDCIKLDEAVSDCLSGDASTRMAASALQLLSRRFASATCMHRLRSSKTVTCSVVVTMRSHATWHVLEPACN